MRAAVCCAPLAPIKLLCEIGGKQTTSCDVDGYTTLRTTVEDLHWTIWSNQRDCAYLSQNLSMLSPHITLHSSGNGNWQELALRPVENEVPQRNGKSNGQDAVLQLVAVNQPEAKKTTARLAVAEEFGKVSARLKGVLMVCLVLCEPCLSKYLWPSRHAQKGSKRFYNGSKRGEYCFRFISEEEGKRL